MNGVHSMVDKKANYVLNKSECYKGFQDERKSVHMLTKEISENQIQQQTKTLKTAEDEAVDFELIQSMNIDDIEINKMHMENSSTCCDMSGFYFIEDTIVDFSFCCRYPQIIRRCCNKKRNSE